MVALEQLAVITRPGYVQQWWIYLSAGATFLFQAATTPFDPLALYQHHLET
ncbi:hypothetical protein [Candidatus Hepatobacter penaei]|uniref:hypothetical protein n=1 Tax=Candidatus Hepatobacter penaei TaxID=1274402 RepID=UPI0012E02208|nr:hypothetical protein [Candidatus Hepatobacter penaei]